MIGPYPNNPIRAGSQYDKGEQVETSKIVVQIHYEKEEVLCFQLSRFDDALVHSWIDCLFYSSEILNDHTHGLMVCFIKMGFLIIFA